MCVFAIAWEWQWELGIAEREMESEREKGCLCLCIPIHTHKHTQTLDEIKTLVYARYAVCCVFLLLFLLLLLLLLFFPFKGEDSWQHDNLNQITRGVIRRIDGWIGAISNRTVRYLPISGMKLLFSNAFELYDYLYVLLFTCFSFHDIHVMVS